jgi:DNA (cytosine-5)-methyltransferase 3A
MGVQETRASLKVLSLFDGISCFRYALGDTPVEYLASEIDKNAIKISKKNYPLTKHLGDVKDISGIAGIDILVGGSPCTDLSVAKKGREGLEGSRSKLFWEYVRIWKEVKPKWFILENVASMSSHDRDIITNTLGIEPVLINAALVSAQTRKRLFWTNIPIICLPSDRAISLKDILQKPEEIDNSLYVTGSFTKIDKKSSNAGGLLQIGHIGKTTGQANRVYDPEGKSVTLTANGGGSGAKTGLYKIGRVELRRLDKEGKRHDGDKTYPVTKIITTTDSNKSNTLTSLTEHNLIVTESSIRKLSPIECERLMGLPDNYTESISKTARYKAVGNAFHVEIMKWIISFIPK